MDERRNLGEWAEAVTLWQLVFGPQRQLSRRLCGDDPQRDVVSPEED